MWLMGNKINREEINREICVAKNCDWSRKNHATVKPDLSVTLRGMKTYRESRIELQNLKVKSISVIMTAL